jgi:hypothetical protein
VKDPATDQIGTLADINENFAAISGSGELTVSGTNVTLPAVTMLPEMCIWKFTFTDGLSDITSDITNLVIDFPDNGITYEVTPSSLNTIYVAMYGGMVNAQPISIYAKTTSGVYRKSAASVTLAVGTTYTSAGLALSSAAASNAVAGDVGSVIGADGNIYPTAYAATNFGTTEQAMIAYVGNETGESAPYNHGLALALTDESGGSKMNWSAAGSACSSKNTSTPVTGATWLLASQDQWNTMITAFGGNAALRDGFSSVYGINLNTSDRYWSSSDSGDYGRTYSFYGSGAWGLSDKGNTWRARACLAF